MTRVAIVGTGNIGSDLLEKVRRSDGLEVVLFSGIDPDSPGIARARGLGVATSVEGAAAVLVRDDVDLVFEATSAAVHKRNAPDYAARELRVIDLTPAKLGIPVVPAVNGERVADELNFSLISCGAQATVPIVAAIASAAAVPYAEIVATIASLSAGPGTRQNIDEFTRTTAAALEVVGGAESGKAIIILNPASPPIHMRNTVFALVPTDADHELIRTAVAEMGECVRAYVPGYRIVAGPEFDPMPDGGQRVAVAIEVTGAGDSLPPYAGNLDIITAAAVGLAERIAA
jgi:acetaldehyde dehydrogenase